MAIFNLVSASELEAAKAELQTQMDAVEARLDKLETVKPPVEPPPVEPPPVEIATLAAKDVTTTSANLSWTPPTAVVTEVGRDGVDSNGGGPWAGPPTALPFQLLLPNTTYTFHAVIDGTRLQTQVKTLAGPVIVPPVTPPPTSNLTRVNVKDFGAVGNGTTDDSAAIKRAESALTAGKALYFPPGNYRFAQQHPRDGAAIFLNKSDTGVEFDTAATLVMANVTGGSGTGHGIEIVGRVSNIRLTNPTIVWNPKPTNRSFGDGIHVTGYPSDSAPASGWAGSSGKVDFLTITNGRVLNAPQTGAVICGVSDVTVDGFFVQDTLADALHFNACRRITVRNHRAVNPGDDGLAFVTYYHATQVWNATNNDGPFNTTILGEWNDGGGSTATNIIVESSHANGIRIQGGRDITVNGAQITNRQSAVNITSGIVGNGIGWSGLAPKGIVMNDVTVTGGQQAVEIQAGNVRSTDDPKFYQFEARFNRLRTVNTPNRIIYTAGQIGTTPALVTAMKAGVVDTP